MKSDPEKLDEMEIESESRIKFSELKLPESLHSDSSFTVKGWIDPLGTGILMKYGKNILWIDDCPKNLASISVWMTQRSGSTSEGFTGSIAGSYINTISVQIDNKNFSLPRVRILYFNSYKVEPIKAAAQIMLCFREPDNALAKGK